MIHLYSKGIYITEMWLYLVTLLFSASDTSQGSGAGSGQVFGLSLLKCLENERMRQQQTADLSAVVTASLDAATVIGDENDVRLSRKSSRTGSHASFCSLTEGAKQVE